MATEPAGRPGVRWLALLVVVVLAAGAGCAEESSPSGSTSTSTSTTTASPSAAEPPHPGPGAVVVEVVDGDTIEVERDGARETVRLIGINSAERGECLADDATRWLRDRIGGRAVELVPDESDRDQYGRLLRYVEVDGGDVGAELVRAGLALARRYPPDTARADEYEAIQRSAEDAGVGMWAADACGDGGTPADVVVSELRLDADGDDNENLNDEWVRLTNEGATPVDLTGWTLKDTSASHRYSFPAGFTLEPAASVTVRTGCGTDTATDLHWCNEGSAVWNNSGDTAFLLDPAGNIVDARQG